MSSGLGELTAPGPQDTIPLKAVADYSLTTLASFDDANGARPQAGLVRDPRGNLYGTTVFGGTFGAGTVFELSPSRGGPHGATR